MSAAAPAGADPMALIDAASLRRWAPAQGRAEQLMILLAGNAGLAASGLLPLAEALHQAFPQALLLGWQAAPTAAPGAAPVPAWFSGPLAADEGAAPAAPLAACLPILRQAVREAQQASAVGPAATALVGFGEGATLALELVALEDGLAGRVLAFGGGYACLPAQAPRHSTLHLFHGADDPELPPAHVRATLEHLGRLQGDATLDIASATGHVLAPALIDCALHRLRTHIPHRTWAAALGMVPGLAERQPPTDGG